MYKELKETWVLSGWVGQLSLLHVTLRCSYLNFLSISSTFSSKNFPNSSTENMFFALNIGFCFRFKHVFSELWNENIGSFSSFMLAVVLCLRGIWPDLCLLYLPPAHRFFFLNEGFFETSPGKKAQVHQHWRCGMFHSCSRLFVMRFLSRGRVSISFFP